MACPRIPYTREQSVNQLKFKYTRFPPPQKAIQLPLSLKFSFMFMLILFNSQIKNTVRQIT